MSALKHLREQYDVSTIRTRLAARAKLFAAQRQILCGIVYGHSTEHGEVEEIGSSWVFGDAKPVPIKAWVWTCTRCGRKEVREDWHKGFTDE